MEKLYEPAGTVDTLESDRWIGGVDDWLASREEALRYVQRRSAIGVRY